MATHTKSVFLYGKPMVSKWKLLNETQIEYTALVNRFIEEMASDNGFLLDLLNNNNHSPRIRQLEKTMRNTHQYPEMLAYISYKSLLNAAVLNVVELDVLGSVLKHELEKKTPYAEKVTEFNQLLQTVAQLSEADRQFYKETVSELFLERLTYARLPYVKKASLQLDTRLSTIESSHSTIENFVVSVKLLGSTGRVAFPVSTSQNSLRRMSQYKTGSVTMTAMDNGKVRFGVPFSKKINGVKPSPGSILAMDAGITNLIAANTGSAYGTFKGMGRLYEEWVEPKLAQRSSLRNKMRSYQKQLKVSSNPYEQEWLRDKIQNMAASLNGKKKMDTCRRRYAHEADKRNNLAVNDFVKEAVEQQALCVYESLDITEFDLGKKANKRDSMWVRGQLVKKVQSKLDWLGIPHIGVEPAYTSKACAKYSNIDDKNRNGKSFVCTVCKHEDDADRNAAINIGNRAFDEDVKNATAEYRFNTYKRHEALRELFASRHRSYLTLTPSA